MGDSSEKNWGKNISETMNTSEKFLIFPEIPEFGIF